MNNWKDKNIYMYKDSPGQPAKEWFVQAELDFIEKVRQEAVGEVIDGVSKASQIVVFRGITELTDKVERKDYFDQLRDKYL